MSEDTRIMKGKDTDGKRGRPNSERVGEAALSSGGQATLSSCAAGTDLLSLRGGFAKATFSLGSPVP